MSFNDMPPLLDSNPPFYPPGTGAGGNDNMYPGAGQPNTPLYAGSTPYPPWLPPNNNPANGGYAPYQPISPGGWGPPSPYAGANHTPYTPFTQLQPQQQHSYYGPPPLSAPAVQGFGQPLTPGWGGGGTPLKRTKSYNGGGHGAGGFIRSNSMGGGGGGGGYGGYPSPPLTSGGGGYYSAYSPTGMQGNDTLGERNLARRPQDWRADYTTREGLAAYLPKVGGRKSIVEEWTDTTRHTIHPILLYTSHSSPPLTYDVRQAPYTTPTSVLLASLVPPRHANPLDFAQLATQPSTPFLRIYHPRLPWYIDVRASHPNGITVHDVLCTVNSVLRTKISGKDYWNEEMSDSDRAAVSRAFQERCQGDLGEIAEGVRYVDFLKGGVLLLGFVVGKRGNWEMKMKKAT